MSIFNKMTVKKTMIASFGVVLTASAIGISAQSAQAQSKAQAQAQARDVSPTILIESVPSDAPEYRRMVFVKYLNGNRVTSNYKAYNRREFINVPDRGTTETVRACAGSRGSSLSDIKAFERAEAKRMRKGQPTEVHSFCIKNIQGWNAGQKDKYLDPIFEGMPWVKKVVG